MAISIALSLIVAVALGKSVCEDLLRSARIVGGSGAPEGGFPYQASVRGTDGNHTCGGAIISSTAVLTAAHCVRGQGSSRISVVTGSNYLNYGGTKYAVSYVRVHPGYSSITLKNDIAVIKLSTPIVFSSTVMPVELTSTNAGGNIDAVLSGWGMTSYPGTISNRLQYAFLKLISVSDCKRRFVFPNVDDSQVCTLVQAGQGACYGDRGSPLVANGYLIGMVSWGRPCALGFPDVYTSVPYFYNWITNNSN